MAPSSPTIATTRKHLSVIHDGIFKKDSPVESPIRPHISARRLSLAANDHDETLSMEQSVPSSPGASNTNAWTPAAEMDEDSIERPEDICELSGDGWDLEEAGWSADDCWAPEHVATSSYIQLGGATPAGENVWNEAEARERTDQNDLLQLLHDDAAPSSNFEYDSAGIWAAPQGYNFWCSFRGSRDVSRR